MITNVWLISRSTKYLTFTGREIFHRKNYKEIKIKMLVEFSEKTLWHAKACCTSARFYVQIPRLVVMTCTDDFVVGTGWSRGKQMFCLFGIACLVDKKSYVILQDFVGFGLFRGGSCFSICFLQLLIADRCVSSACSVINPQRVTTLGKAARQGQVT